MLIFLCLLLLGPSWSEWILVKQLLQPSTKMVSVTRSTGISKPRSWVLLACQPPGTTILWVTAITVTSWKERKGRKKRNKRSKSLPSTPWTSRQQTRPQSSTPSSSTNSGTHHSLKSTAPFPLPALASGFPHKWRGFGSNCPRSCAPDSGPTLFFALALPSSRLLLSRDLDPPPTSDSKGSSQAASGWSTPQNSLLPKSLLFSFLFQFVCFSLMIDNLSCVCKHISWLDATNVTTNSTINNIASNPSISHLWGQSQGPTMES